MLSSPPGVDESDDRPAQPKEAPVSVAAGQARPAADVPTDDRSRFSMLRAFRGDPLALMLGLPQ
jgi:hypothetical protein